MSATSGTGFAHWAFMALSLPAILAFGWSVLQVQDDAERRGLPHRLILLLVIITWPVGVLLYMVAKPPAAQARAKGGRNDG